MAVMSEQGRQAEATGDAVLRALALKARGMSGADIERLVREARQKARRARRQLAFSDVFDLLAAVRPPRSQALRWCMAVHEAGHAVARLVLDLGRITSVSIDGPAGGYTEGKTATTGVETESVFDGLLAVSLAGRAAEEEFLGSVSAGAGGSPDSDMGKATALALAMETELGFAETWPLLYRHADNQTTLLAYNPLLAEQVNARLEAAYARARELIRRNKNAVRFLADGMMQHDTLEGEHLQVVLREVRKRINPVGDDSVDVPVPLADAGDTNITQAENGVSLAMSVVPRADAWGIK